FARRIALRVSRGNRAAGRDADELSAAPYRRRIRPTFPCRAHEPGSAGEGASSDRARARAHRRTTLRSIFPDRLRYRRIRPFEGHSLSRARIRRELRGVLLPRHHLGRSLAHGNAVRALHFARTQRAARYRRRLRASKARGGHPVHLRKVQSRARRVDGDGDYVSPALGAARRRQGAGSRSRASRSAGEIDGVVGWAPGVTQAARGSWIRSRQSGHATLVRSGHDLAWFSAASVAAHRWLRDLAWTL